MRGKLLLAERVSRPVTANRKDRTAPINIGKTRSVLTSWFRGGGANYLSPLK